MSYIVFLIGIHFAQGWTATTEQGVTRERRKQKQSGYGKVD